MSDEADDVLTLLYRVMIHHVDGARFYAAVGPDRGELLAFVRQHDHEGSTVELTWVSIVDIDETPGTSSDPERIYRILAEQEDV